MFADTTTLVLTAGNKTLTKISPDSSGASLFQFRNATHLYRLKIRHSTTKATLTKPAYDRHNVELVVTTFAVGAVAAFDKKVYVVIEQLASDSDLTITDTLAEWLRNTTNANVVKLLNWEG